MYFTFWHFFLLIIFILLCFLLKKNIEKSSHQNLNNLYTPTVFKDLLIKDSEDSLKISFIAYSYNKFATTLDRQSKNGKILLILNKNGEKNDLLKLEKELSDISNGISLTKYIFKDRIGIFYKTHETVINYIIYKNSFAKIEYPNTECLFELPQGVWPFKTPFIEYHLGGLNFKNSMISHEVFKDYQEKFCL